jgi:hypothetical protein
MKKLILILFLAILVLGLYNCGGAPKPEQELSLAKQKIDLAKSEEAPSYTPNEFNTALNDYVAATNAVAQGKNDVAKQKALSSISNSDIAIAKTRQLKSEKALTTFGDLLKEAEEMKADVIIPEKFENYKKSYEASESLHKQGMYQDSYTNSKAVLPSLESDVSELRTKWNNAREELRKAIDATQDPFYKGAKKRLTNETAEIENIISEAKTLLDQAKLDESIQKSKEAQEKTKNLINALRKVNEDYLNETDKKLKELKINRNLIFMYFGNKINTKEFKIAQLINIYEKKEEGLVKVEEKDISQMTYEELTNYKAKLESEMNNLKSQIRELYNSAQIDYSNGEYLRSMETLDKVNELVSQYNEIQDTYNKVSSEIDKREKTKVSKKPAVEQPKKESVGTYKVKKGDFLSKIATKLFNGGYWWWPKIFVLNKDKLSDPDIIDEGMELKVPTSLPE